MWNKQFEHNILKSSNAITFPIKMKARRTRVRALITALFPSHTMCNNIGREWLFWNGRISHVVKNN